MIPSLQPQRFNIVGVRILKIDRSSWTDCFSSSERWEVPLLGEAWEHILGGSTSFWYCCWETQCESRGVTGHLSSQMTQVSFVGIDGVSVYRGVTTGSVGGALPRERNWGPVTRMRWGWGLMRQGEWESAEHHLKLLGKFWFSSLESLLFSCFHLSHT